MSKIPPIDLAREYQTIRHEIEAAVGDVLVSGQYIGGPQVAEFEAEFGTYVGTSECVACNSGTDALYLALRALDVGPGDEVITSPFTFFATAETISLTGATPMFVDIDETFNLDAQQVEAAISEKTRAIVPVHLFGQPADMTRLGAIAASHQLAIVEDCAQATGARWQGRPVGSLGTVGCFSFFPTKNLGAFGDGGAVTTNDPAIARRIRRLKDHGASARYYHEELGANSRLDALQAAILRVKLRYLDGWNARRQAIATTYSQCLAAVDAIAVPSVRAGAISVWNQYTIRVPQSRPSQNTDNGGAISTRDRLQGSLQESGIATSIYYPFPLHLQPVYRHLGYRSGQLPLVERICTEVLSLPMFPELSHLEQDRIITVVKDALSQLGDPQTLPS
jgi:dTDP-4-amino-4,6-dideoxygalactose transaminase